MKHFIYKYSEHTTRNGHTVKTVNLYRIVRNVPAHVGMLSETFVDKNQLVMMVLEHFKALPEKYFERHPLGGTKHMPWSLKADGIATFTEI